MLNLKQLCHFSCKNIDESVLLATHSYHYSQWLETEQLILGVHLSDPSLESDSDLGLVGDEADGGA